MSRDHNRDSRYDPNAAAGPSRIDRARGGPRGAMQGTQLSNARIDAHQRTGSVGGVQGQAGGRAPSRTTTLLREFHLQEQQRRQDVDSARSSVAQTLARVERVLGANSGVAIGPIRARMDGATVHMTVKSAQNRNAPHTHNATKSAQGNGIFRPGPPVPGSKSKAASPVTHIVKSANKHILPWDDQDELHDSRVRSNKRAREAGTFADDDVPAPRRVGTIATATRPRPAGMRTTKIAQPQKRPRLPEATVDRQLALRVDGEVVDEGPGPEEEESSAGERSDMDVDEEPPQLRPPEGRRAQKSASGVTLPRPRSLRSSPGEGSDMETDEEALAARPPEGRRTATKSAAARTLPPELPHLGRQKTALKKVATNTRGTFVKAARKVNIVATDSESEEDSDDDKSDSSSSTSQQSTHQPAEDSDEEYELDVKQEEQDAPLLRPFGPAELITLDSPPHITISLPQIASEYNKTTFSPRLVSALSTISLASVQLQETRQLPFLLRNLRKGFIHRCKLLGMSMVKDVGDVSLSVRYQHVDNIQHQVLLRRWRCPICSLHGKFPNQGVLAKHLSWDHAELFVEWERHRTTSWTVNILVPEVIPSDLGEGGEDVPTNAAATESGSSERAAQPLLPSPVPGNRRETLFPFVALSPPTSPRQSTSAEPVSIPPTSPTPETSASPAPPLVSPTPFADIKGKGKLAVYQTTPSASTPSFRGQSTTATTTSTTGRSSTATTVRMPPSAFIGPDGKRYPTPPPPEDILGPSASKPYLPAEPIYPGGQKIYYSCRPGGATLYDLLNTLPMEQYGVLAWAVLEREEEIFEDDEVKDEYKVMHALWARWIFLNRTQFLAGYYKAVVSFVDEYWRMIHRAAGWDALRYWLLVLLANRYLSAKEVATLLKRYEAYTGMDHWKD